MKRKLLIGAATAILGGGGTLYAFDTLADHAVTYTDAQTFIVRGEWARLGANNVACRGTCRTATVAGTYRLHCEVSATGATVGACLVSLAGNCTPSACENAQ